MWGGEGALLIILTLILNLYLIVGFSCLLLDSTHTRLFASSKDHIIYEYNCSNFNPEPGTFWKICYDCSFTAISICVQT